MQGSVVYADEIVNQFRQTAVFVSVLTSGYLKSDWCMKEVREFCERVEREAGWWLRTKAGFSRC
jgi:hypothetical protein